MSGVKGMSGRPKSATNVQRYIIASIDKNWTALVKALIAKAIEGDREALFYCFDRRLGKPKTQIELEGGEHLGVGIVTELFGILADKQRELETRRETKVITEGELDATKQEAGQS